MTASAPAAAVTVKPRVPFWDNARFLCMVLVVVGHGIQRLTPHSDNALVLYLLIFSFHMPAFAIISGYFSKSGPPTAQSMKRILTDIVLPYLIFEAIWSTIKFLLTGNPDFNPTTASWTLWFLLALAIFRVVLPYLALLRFPLLLAVLMSIGVGYLDNVTNTFALSRTFGILPFFVLGWQLKEWGVIDRVFALTRGLVAARIGAATVFVAWTTLLVLNLSLARQVSLKDWFFYNDSYHTIGADQWWAGLVRLALMALTVLLCACFLVLVPRRETWFTDFGQATMYVYLLHTFVLYPVRESGLLGPDHASDLWLVGMVVVSVGIALALSTGLVRKIFRPIIEPKPRWLFRETV